MVFTNLEKAYNKVPGKVLWRCAHGIHQADSGHVRRSEDSCENDGRRLCELFYFFYFDRVALGIDF